VATVTGVPEPDPGAPAPKEDPGALVLRGRPRPVVRFRRGLILGLAGTAAGGLAVVAWLALEPPSFRLAGSADSDGAPLRPGVPEAVAGAPDSYGEVPQLGPPLPGDLGRPILEHERSMAGIEPGEGGDPVRAAIEAERQRRATEQAAARASALLVQRSGQAAVAEAPGTSSPESPASPAGTTASRTSSGENVAAGLQPASSPWTLAAGTVIPASLVTGLNSDLAGPVIAQVTENVRDSATGRTVLVPQGARLIGRYDSSVSYGQRRALLVWQRIVFPDGTSVALDDMPATDRAGYAGVEDGVDFHTRRLVRGIALSTLLGLGTEISLGDDEGDLARALRESAQGNAARAGDRIVARDLDVAPTLTVRPGWPVRAIVDRDLVLRPWRG
jgi:type IV secretion system protein VirB10